MDDSTKSRILFCRLIKLMESFHVHITSHCRLHSSECESHQINQRMSRESFNHETMNVWQDKLPDWLLASSQCRSVLHIIRLYTRPRFLGHKYISAYHAISPRREETLANCMLYTLQAAIIYGSIVQHTHTHTLRLVNNQFHVSP